MNVRKQFVDIGDRRVMIRYAGCGPALVLLHQSPQNSRAMLPWIQRLAEYYAVFAPDTPGFGDSDPLPLAQPEVPDYAAALSKLFDALGIERALIYGVHTGAVTGLRFALDFPEKVAALVCDGYARFNALEREALLAHYLPPFEPLWDGSHLTWLFARMREQHLFFPWHDSTQSARLAYPAPKPAHLHSAALDVLEVGDGYRAGYRAPFLYDDMTAAARLDVPTAIYYRAEDVLAPHLQRLPGRPAHVTAELIVGGAPALIARADKMFAAHAAKASITDSAKCINAARSVARMVIATDEGELGFRVISGRGKGIVMHLHDIGCPHQTPVTTDLAGFTLLPDLPGHGASCGWSHERCAPDVVAKALLALVDWWGNWGDNMQNHKPNTAQHLEHMEHITIVAVGGSSVIGAELALLMGVRCTHLTLQNPLPLDAAERTQFLTQLPDLTPTSTGAQFIEAWNFARMKYLFWPWLNCTELNDRHAVRQTIAPAPRRVHAEVVEILKADQCFHALWRESLAVDLAQQLLRLTIPVELLTTLENDSIPMEQLAQRLASAAGLKPIAVAGGNTCSNVGWKSWRK